MSEHAAVAAYQDFFTRAPDAVVADLESYAVLLRKWQPVQNLVSRETLPDLWSRHFADSLQLLRHVPAGATSFMDFGSGGGFPALPLAIALKGSPAQFTLIEPTSRKVSFLRTVARELGLAVTIHSVRSDQFDSREMPVPDVLTSRALAALPQLCSWLLPFFGPNTVALLHKGREHGEERTEASTLWDFDVIVNKSDTDADGVVLALTNLRAKTVR